MDSRREVGVVNVTEQEIDALWRELDRLVKESESFFERANHAIHESKSQQPPDPFDRRQDADFVSEVDRTESIPRLSNEIGHLILKIIRASKLTPLVGEVDNKDLRVAVRSWLAALRIHRYHNWETNVITDEDTVVGAEPAGQSENPCTIFEAHKQFHSASESVQRVWN